MTCRLVAWCNPCKFFFQIPWWLNTMGWPGQDLVKGRENTSSHHCHSAINVWIVFATILMMASLVSCRVVHIRGEGASFPKDVYVDWITAYRILRADYLDVNLTYLSSGSSAGIDAIMGKNDYSVNYAGSDTVLSATQQQEAPDLVMFPTMAGWVSFHDHGHSYHYEPYHGHHHRHHCHRHYHQYRICRHRRHRQNSSLRLLVLIQLLLSIVIVISSS